MTNAETLFRSLIIYGICLPLAIFLGYLLATPLDAFTIVTIGLLLVLFMVPLLLRWHYPWLILFWNSTAGLFFLPGKPSMAMALIGVSFMIAILSYIMNRNLKFISVPSLTWPLMFIAAVVFGTAELNGGIGLNALGSSAIGGKRYVMIFVGIIGFFALTARRIQPEKRRLYVDLFYIGGLTGAISNLAAVVGPSMYFIFLIFPADMTGSAADTSTSGITRLGGIALTSMAMMSWLLARYGMKGMLNSDKRWRPILFVCLIAACMLGGYRSMLITILLLCGILFYQEGLMRSRLLPMMILTGVLVVAMTISMANKLPLSMQRSLSFLPLDLNAEAVSNARDSSEWRLEMWRHVLPQVPRYLLLGKGLALDANELDMWSRGLNRGEDGSAGSAMAGDYHNGPLSLIMPFGIFGVLGFIWFLAASVRVLCLNYKLGDPDLILINRFLLATFLVKILLFFFIMGSFYSDLLAFTGLIGLSVALNGGVCSRTPVEPAARPAVRNRFKLAGATR